MLVSTCSHFVQPTPCNSTHVQLATHKTRSPVTTTVSSIPVRFQLTMPALTFPLEQIQPTISFLQRHPRLLTTTSGAILAFVIRRSISNYHAYIAMGPGGLPHNVYGWLRSLCFKPFGREHLSTEQYDQDGNKESFLSYGEIKERRGDRPKMSWHIAPSRQLDRYSPPEIQQVGATYLFRLQLTITLPS